MMSRSRAAGRLGRKSVPCTLYAQHGVTVNEVLLPRVGRNMMFVRAGGGRTVGWLGSSSLVVDKVVSRMGAKARGIKTIAIRVV